MTEQYLLTTKLYCGYCGAYMVGESGTGRGKKFHQYYKCVSVKKHRGCKKKSVRKARIENMLNAIQQGVLISSTKGRLDALEETKGRLEAAILQEEMQMPLITQEQVTFFPDRYRKMDATVQEQRQQLIDTFFRLFHANAWGFVFDCENVGDLNVNIRCL